MEHVTANELNPGHLRVLRLTQVMHVTGLCRSMIYRLESEQQFPARIKIGARAVGWLQQEVDEWVYARIAHRPRVPAGRGHVVSLRHGGVVK